MYLCKKQAYKVILCALFFSFDLFFKFYQPFNFFSAVVNSIWCDFVSIYFLSGGK